MPRHRRLIASLILLSFAMLLAACTTLNALVGNQVSFTAPQLQAQLDRRFPRDYEKLGGLVTLRVTNPRISIPQSMGPQGSGRLRLDFDLGIGGMGLTTASPAGHFALESGLRFDPQTRGLHLSDPAIMGVDVPALGGALNDTTRGALNAWLADYAKQEPVYRLDDNVWERLAGRRIGATTIGDGKVTLHLDQ